MNSLNYLSRQLDVLATSGTPPSTPTRGTNFNTSGRPPRAKSYGRIPSRRPSHQGTPSATPTPSFPGHASKRSFSSPALWSFRKPTLTPSVSPVTTPAPVLKRTTSYDFSQAPKVESEMSPARPLLYKIFNAILETMYAMWIAISGYLVIPSIFVPRTSQALDNAKNMGEADTSADEKEETDDDGIVTRAPKRSSVEQHYKDASVINASLEAYQMSTTTTLVHEEPTSQFEQAILILDPPSPEEVQARTETPRIDLIPPTPKSLTPSPSVIRRKSEDNSGLLPTPLLSSLLVKSNSSPVPTVASLNALQAPQQSPRTPPGLHQPKTLVLDLDETLIHSTSRALRAHAGGGLFSMGGFGFGFGEKRGREAGHMVEVILGGRCTLYHVYKRPFVDYFLRKVSSWYTLVIFTASMQEYADPVIDWLDAGRGILTRRLFRESCTQLANGSYTKDLSLVEPDLSRVCLIDNSPVSYNVNPANGIPIEGWTSDPSDEALLHLLPVLDSLRFAKDVRRILGIRLFN